MYLHRKKARASGLFCVSPLPVVGEGTGEGLVTARRPLPRGLLKREGG